MSLNTIQRQHGFSLVEIMVSMAIGLLITLAVGSLFITSKKDYKQNDATAKMQENARFAVELISQDLRHAGFFANTLQPTGTGVNYDAMTLVTPSTDCGAKTASGRGGLYNLGPVTGDRRYMLVFGNQIADVTSGSAGAVFSGCLETDEVKPDSSLLLIKRLKAEITSAPTPSKSAAEDKRLDNTPYLYANGGTAYFYTHPSAEPLPGSVADGAHWEYQPRIYYIDSKDALRRKELQGLTLVSEPLAEGIEAIHVDFGINKIREGTDLGTPDYAYTPAVNAVSIDDDDVNFAVSATLYVLARTTTPDPDQNYKDEKSYQLGPNGPTIGPFSSTDLIDGKTAASSRTDYRYSYSRRVYSTTVVLKNLHGQVVATKPGE